MEISSNNVTTLSDNDLMLNGRGDKNSAGALISAPFISPTMAISNLVHETSRKSKSDKDKSNCYCGKERNHNIIELLCSGCQRWFHESCINYHFSKIVPFMLNYNFVCKNCSATGLETFKRGQAQFSQMCVTALGNLHQQAIKEGDPKTCFSMEKDIIPFIDNHWESLTKTPRRVTQTWHSTIAKALIKDTGTVFYCLEKGNIDDDSNEFPKFGLKNLNLSEIRPQYDVSGKGKGIKRKNTDPLGSSRKTVRGDAPTPKLPPHGYPLEHPFNKDGYRYILAEPDPHAPFRQEFDESSDWAGRPIPGWLYRSLLPSGLLLALHDRAPQLKISEDRLSVLGDKGYCTVRANQGVIRGTWYWECGINDLPDNAAVRLGWGQDYCNLQAPLGYDKFGYSWRSKKGTVFHESKGKSYSSGYSVGDVLGFLIHLPKSSQDSALKYLPQTYKDKPLVKFKNHLYYEDKDNLQQAIKRLKPLKRSYIEFFKNGKSCGIAVRDINRGKYYPTLSLYKGASVTVNFGPQFKFKPDKSSCKAMCDRTIENMAEQTMADILYLIHNEGKLNLDS